MGGNSRAGRYTWLGVTAVCMLLLSACNVWEQVGAGPENTRFNAGENGITPDNVGSLSVQWSASTDSLLSEPVVSGGRVFTTRRARVGMNAGGGGVQSYDLATSQMIWERELAPPSATRATPVVLAAGSLWVGYTESEATYCSSKLARLDPETGATTWSETTGAPLQRAVVAAGSTVAYVTFPACSPPDNRPRLVVQDVDAGSRWSYQFPAGSGTVLPSIGNGTIYVAAAGALYAFDAAGCEAATCEPSWVTSLALDGVEAWLGEDRPAVGPDGTVYVGMDINLQTVVRAVDGETGAHLWRTGLHSSPGQGWMQVAVAHGQLYVSDNRNDGVASKVEVFPAAGCGQPVCDPAWTTPFSGGPIAVAGDVLYVGGNGVAAFDAHGCGASLCQPLVRVPVGNAYKMSVAGGRVLAVIGVLNQGDTFTALGPAAS